MSPDAKAGALVGALAVPFLLLVSGYVIGTSSWVACCVWLWYAVPLGLPVIGWKSWVGLWFLRGLLFPGKTAISQEKESGWNTFAHLAAPWFVLLLAWLIK